MEVVQLIQSKYEVINKCGGAICFRLRYNKYITAQIHAHIDIKIIDQHVIWDGKTKYVNLYQEYQNGYCAQQVPQINQFHLGTNCDTFFSELITMQMVTEIATKCGY